MMYPTQYDTDAKQDEMMRRAAMQRLAREAQPGTAVSFRRALELLVGAISALNNEPRRQPEVAEPIPAKLATDSGIYRIR